MALSKIDAANFLTGTIPQGNVANASLGAVTSLPAAISTGKVLQVVQGTTNTQVSHTTSYADTTLTASITPSSTSNKIFVSVNQHCYNQGNQGMSIKLLRGSTAVYTPSQSYMFYTEIQDSHIRSYQSFDYLDTPSSTSALTYKTQAIAYNSSYTIKTQSSGRWTSFITLMEVAG